VNRARETCDGLSLVGKFFKCNSTDAAVRAELVECINEYSRLAEGYFLAPIAVVAMPPSDLEYGAVAVYPEVPCGASTADAAMLSSEEKMRLFFYFFNFLAEARAEIEIRAKQSYGDEAEVLLTDVELAMLATTVYGPRFLDVFSFVITRFGTPLTNAQALAKGPMIQFLPKSACRTADDWAGYFWKVASNQVFGDATDAVPGVISRVSNMMLSLPKGLEQIKKKYLLEYSTKGLIDAINSVVRPYQLNKIAGCNSVCRRRERLPDPVIKMNLLRELKVRINTFHISFPLFEVDDNTCASWT
jgi:hypothetical protein